MDIRARRAIKYASGNAMGKTKERRDRMDQAYRIPAEFPSSDSGRYTGS
jgi:hypothetical protein